MWSNGFSPPSLSNTHALLCILKFRESKKQKLLTTFVVVAANPCFLLLPKLQGSSFYYVHNWNYEWKSFKILTLLAPKNWPVPTTKKNTCVFVRRQGDTEFDSCLLKVTFSEYTVYRKRRMKRRREIIKTTLQIACNYKSIDSILTLIYECSLLISI